MPHIVRIFTVASPVIVASSVNGTRDTYEHP
jgi:hypothetical protein